jgi:hypothetical protein
MDRVLGWAKAHPILALIAVVVVISLLASPFTGGGSGDSDKKPRADDTTAAAEEPAPDEEAPPAKPVDRLRAALRKTKVDVESVSLRKDGHALVEFNVRDNLSDNLIRVGIGKDVFAIAEAASKADVNIISELAMRGLFPLVDKYGNEDPGQVFFTTFLGSDLGKINYDDVVATSFDNIENLAVDGIVMLHQDLR